MKLAIFPVVQVIIFQSLNEDPFPNHTFDLRNYYNIFLMSTSYSMISLYIESSLVFRALPFHQKA